MSIWRNSDGKIVRGTGCTIARCDTSPCLPDLPCCPEGESPGETLTFAWASSEFGGTPGPGGSATLTYSAETFAYTGTYNDPNVSETFLVSLACTGATDGRTFALTGGGAAASGGSDTSDSCTTLLLDFGDLSGSGSGGSDLFGVTVSN